VNVGTNLVIRAKFRVLSCFISSVIWLVAVAVCAVALGSSLSTMSCISQLAAAVHCGDGAAESCGKSAWRKNRSH
jgi:hypothetical protein